MARSRPINPESLERERRFRENWPSDDEANLNLDEAEVEHEQQHQRDLPARHRRDYEEAFSSDANSPASSAPDYEDHEARRLRLIQEELDTRPLPQNPPTPYTDSDDENQKDTEEEPSPDLGISPRINSRLFQDRNNGNERR